MKIKAFASHWGIASLEQKINNFIQNENIKIIKIHYEMSFGAYSALIEYEEK